MFRVTLPNFNSICCMGRGCNMLIKCDNKSMPFLQQLIIHYITQKLWYLTQTFRKAGCRNLGRPKKDQGMLTAHSIAYLPESRALRSECTVEHLTAQNFHFRYWEIVLKYPTNVTFWIVGWKKRNSCASLAFLMPLALCSQWRYCIEEETSSDICACCCEAAVQCCRKLYFFASLFSLAVVLTRWTRRTCFPEAPLVPESVAASSHPQAKTAWTPMARQKSTRSFILVGTILTLQR